MSENLGETRITGPYLHDLEDLGNMLLRAAGAEFVFRHNQIEPGSFIYQSQPGFDRAEWVLKLDQEGSQEALSVLRGSEESGTGVLNISWIRRGKVRLPYERWQTKTYAARLATKNSQLARYDRPGPADILIDVIPLKPGSYSSDQWLAYLTAGIRSFVDMSEILLPERDI